jgi:hypothetical protein
MIRLVVERRSLVSASSLCAPLRTNTAARCSPVSRAAVYFMFKPLPFNWARLHHKNMDGVQVNAQFLVHAPSHQSLTELYPQRTSAWQNICASFK